MVTSQWRDSTTNPSNNDFVMPPSASGLRIPPETGSPVPHRQSSSLEDTTFHRRSDSIFNRAAASPGNSSDRNKGQSSTAGYQIELGGPDFVASLLPLFSSPQVVIRIVKHNDNTDESNYTSTGIDTGDNKKDKGKVVEPVGENRSPDGVIIYQVSVAKDLICCQSSFFMAMLKPGNFTESQTGIVNLVEEKGIVTQESLELLIQWFYTSRIGIQRNEVDSSETLVSRLLSFARLADMVGVSGIEHEIAFKIKQYVLRKTNRLKNCHNLNKQFFNRQQFESVALLPIGHSVRKVFLESLVQPFLHGCESENLKFVFETSDMVKEFLPIVEDVIKGVKGVGRASVFDDPFSGLSRALMPFRWKELLLIACEYLTTNLRLTWGIGGTFTRD